MSKDDEVTCDEARKLAQATSNPYDQEAWFRFIDQAEREQAEHHAMMHGMHQREAKLRAACEYAFAEYKRVGLEMPTQIADKLREALVGGR